MNRASSSRQSLLPMRVTDNGRMSLATPQRASGAGMSRNSAFGGFGGAEKIKDPRPLHDKSFVQQCIRQLCEYLGENGFPSPVTVKSLQSPTSKEFLKIFSFIYSFLDPTFQMPTSKIEEEIPRILKDLGYPFPISKSSMYSVGAPHTWPQILGGLIWLIDSVKLFDTMREQDLLFPDFSDGGIETEDGIEFNKLFISYTSKSYDRFMQGADTFEEEDAEFFPKLKDLYNVDEAHLESLAEKYKILTDEVERLEKESQQVEAELAKYHTLARKLKLIPASAENACGHDFEIKFTIECGPSRIGHYKNQIHTPLMNMISQVEEEINKLVPQKLSMVETSEQEAEREEHKWSTELDSLESHKKLLEKKVTDGYDEAVEQLKATRQEYHLVLQETSEERRIVANNLSSILDIVTNHVSFVEDHHKRVARDYQEAIKEDTLEQLREIVDKYHLVLQETSEERRIVANNLSSILDIVTNHVSFVEFVVFAVMNKLYQRHCPAEFLTHTHTHHHRGSVAEVLSSSSNRLLAAISASDIYEGYLVYEKFMNKLYQRHCPAEFLTHTHTHHHRGSVAEVLSSSSNRLLAAISASDIYEGYLVYEKWSTRRASAQYTRVGEQLRLVIPAPVQCSVACGGRLCKYENPIKWTEEEQAIKGLYSSWITENILAMARPSSEAIQQHAIIQQFKQ
ncbi:UNVERIFIED_CONTAM: hypothetical protein FKN15_041414 [Acipenser sinensis]